MKALVVYATLSGSTMTAAELIEHTLKEQDIDAASVMADISVKDQIAAIDALIFASPSWEDNGVDGQPLPEIRQLIESLTKESLAGKKVAICGLGDTSYPHFCGAVDVLQDLLKARGVTPVITSLRIDKYYSSPENEQKVKDWTKNFAKTLQG